MRHLHTSTFSIAILGALTTACAVQQPMALPAAPAPVQAMQAAQIELLIALKPGHGLAELEDLGRRLGFTVTRYWPQINSASVRLERFGKIESVMGALARAESIVSVQPVGQVILEER